MRVEGGIIKCGSRSYPVSQITSVEVNSSHVHNNAAQGLLLVSGVIGYMLFSKAGGSVQTLFRDLQYVDKGLPAFFLSILGFAAAVFMLAKTARRRAFSVNLWLSDRSSVRFEAHSEAEASSLRRTIEQTLTTRSETDQY